MRVGVGDQIALQVVHDEHGLHVVRADGEHHEGAEQAVQRPEHQHRHDAVHDEVDRLPQRDLGPRGAGHVDRRVDHAAAAEVLQIGHQPLQEPDAHADAERQHLEPVPAPARLRGMKAEQRRSDLGVVVVAELVGLAVVRDLVRGLPHQARAADEVHDRAQRAGAGAATTDRGVVAAVHREAQARDDHAGDHHGEVRPGGQAPHPRGEEQRDQHHGLDRQRAAAVVIAEAARGERAVDVAAHGVEERRIAVGLALGGGQRADPRDLLAEHAARAIERGAGVVRLEERSAVAPGAQADQLAAGVALDEGAHVVDLALDLEPVAAVAAIVGGHLVHGQVIARRHSRRA